MGAIDRNIPMIKTFDPVLTSKTHLLLEISITFGSGLASVIMA